MVKQKAQDRAREPSGDAFRGPGSVGDPEDRALGAGKKTGPHIALAQPPGGRRRLKCPSPRAVSRPATAESAAGPARGFDDGGRVVVGRRLMREVEWCAPSAMLMATSVSLSALHSADAPAVDETVREDDARGARAREVVKPPNIDERARLRRRAEARARVRGKPREAPLARGREHVALEAHADRLGQKRRRLEVPRLAVGARAVSRPIAAADRRVRPVGQLRAQIVAPVAAGRAAPAAPPRGEGARAVATRAAAAARADAAP